MYGFLGPGIPLSTKDSAWGMALKEAHTLIYSSVKTHPISFVREETRLIPHGVSCLVRVEWLVPVERVRFSSVPLRPGVVEQHSVRCG